MHRRRTVIHLKPVEKDKTALFFTKVRSLLARPKRRDILFFYRAYPRSSIAPTSALLTNEAAYILCSTFIGPHLTTIVMSADKHASRTLAPTRSNLSPTQSPGEKGYCRVSVHLNRISTLPPSSFRAEWEKLHASRTKKLRPQ